NTLAALRAGVTVVDASAGGIGGCPYAESATGNLPTEDLVWMLHGLGIETGVDLAALVATSRWRARHLGRPSPSRVGQALSAKAEGPGCRAADERQGGAAGPRVTAPRTGAPQAGPQARRDP